MKGFKSNGHMTVGKGGRIWEGGGGGGGGWSWGREAWARGPVDRSTSLKDRLDLSLRPNLFGLGDLARPVGDPYEELPNYFHFLILVRLVKGISGFYFSMCTFCKEPKLFF